MERRKFMREFKLEAVRLIKGRGVSYAQSELRRLKMPNIGVPNPFSYHFTSVRGSPGAEPSSFVAYDASSGPVDGVVGIEGGVVSGVINLESSSVGASDWRPRHGKHYQEV
jgi:hypothetical protein